MSPEPLASEPVDQYPPRSNWRMVVIFGASFIILGILCVIVLYVVTFALKIDALAVLSRQWSDRLPQKAWLVTNDPASRDQGNTR